MKLHRRLANYIAGTLRWPDFTRIQKIAVPELINGKNSLIVAKTGAGKTEAAMIPVFDRLLRTGLAPGGGVFCIYIAPLRTLLNDMAARLEKWCENFSFSFTLWHSDAPQNRKAAFVRSPTDMLMITPESLESYMINRSEADKRKAFNAVRFVVIDEAHSFYESGRGYQLNSLLSRLSSYTSNKFQTIGLSATVENPDKIARWLFSGEDYYIADELSSKKLDIRVVYAGDSELRGFLTRNAESKIIAFTRSRAECEYLADNLASSGYPGEMFVHHSSVERALRENAEKRFKSGPSGLMINAASFELGIDIGDVDMVVNAGALESPSRTRQRAGRAGRRSPVSRCVNFVSGHLELLMSLATINMINGGRLERKHEVEKPYDIYLHQLLATVRQFGSIDSVRLFDELCRAESHKNINEEEFRAIVDKLKAIEFIKEESGRIRLYKGFEEKFSRMNFLNFYSVFESERQFFVVENALKIGSLDPAYVYCSVKPGEKFMLAGSKYIALDVDRDRFIVRARRTGSGKAPRWKSDGCVHDYCVTVEARRILANALSGEEKEKLMAALDEKAVEKYNELIAASAASGIRRDGIYIRADAGSGEIKVLTFGSVYVNNVIAAFISAAIRGVKADSTVFGVCISIGSPNDVFGYVGRVEKIISAIPSVIENLPEALYQAVFAAGNKIEYSGKFAQYLPEELYNKLYLMRYFEPSTAASHIRNANFFRLENPELLKYIKL